MGILALPPRPQAAMPVDMRPPGQTDDARLGYLGAPSGTATPTTLGTLSATVTQPALSAVSVSGELATVTFASAHSLAVGDLFTLDGFAPVAFCGAYSVVSVASTTLTARPQAPQLWLAPPSAPFRLWSCHAAVAGRAKWMPIFGVDGALPLDLVTGAQIAVGPIKLRSAYVGQCMRVARASDMTQADIGWVSIVVQGAPVQVVDAAAAQAFAAGSELRLVTAYDHSVNVNDMTAVAWVSGTGAAPAVTSATVSGGVATVTFASAHGLQLDTGVLLAGFTASAWNAAGIITAITSTTIQFATAASSAATVIGTVTTWQNAPKLAFNSVNGITAMSWDSETASSLFIPKWLQNAAVTGIPNRASMFMAARARFARMANAACSFGVTGGLPSAGGADTQFLSTISNGVIGLNGQARRAIPPSTPAVYGWRDNAGFIDYYAGNGYDPAFVSGRASSSKTGFVLGSANNATFPAQYDLFGFIWWDKTLTTAQATLVRASMHLIAGIAPQATDTVVLWGDSIPAGQGSLVNRGRGVQEIGLYGQPVRLFNVSRSGTTVQAEITSASGFFLDVIARLYAATGNCRRWVIVIPLGTNDVGAGRTGAQIYADLQTAVALCKALGRNVRVVVTTIMPRTGLSGAAQTALDTFNSLIRADHSFAHGFADYASDPMLSFASDARIYGDGLHTTSIGGGYIAAIEGAAVARLLAA